MAFALPPKAEASTPAFVGLKSRALQREKNGSFDTGLFLARLDASVQRSRSYTITSIDADATPVAVAQAMLQRSDGKRCQQLRPGDCAHR